MTYEARSNGTHVLKCDTGICSNELLAPEMDQLFEDANLHGWLQQDDKHACPNCTRGANLMKAATKAVFGEHPTVRAVADVTAGMPVFDGSGRQVAVYSKDGKAGEQVEVELYVPVKQEVPVSEKYAEILGRQPSNPAGSSGHSAQPQAPATQQAQPAPHDDLFDIFGESPDASAAAPVRPQAASEPVPKVDIASLFEPVTKGATGAYPPKPPNSKRTLEAPAGTAGGAGLVKAPERPVPAEVAKLSKPKRHHGIKIENLKDVDSIFGFLDTAWTPDDK